MKNDLYVWFDLEYSSLELENAFLLQAAALITDTSLQRVLPQDEDVLLIAKIPPGGEVSDWVEENLRDLLSRCRSTEALDVETIDIRLADYVDKAIEAVSGKKETVRPFLAGNTIHADWWLARRFLPRFLDRLHYRQLDVTSFKIEWVRIHQGNEFDKNDPQLIQKYFPEAVVNEGGRHDAYYDVQASIAELAFYREQLMKDF